MNPVTWFEIPVNNMDRAKKFYEGVFNKELTPMEMGPHSMNMFPWEEGGMGSAGTLIKGEGFTPSFEGSLVYFTVEDIEGTLAKVDSSGGKTIIPKMDIGEHGFVAHFQDTEGNRVALHSQN